MPSPRRSAIDRQLDRWSIPVPWSRPGRRRVERLEGGSDILASVDFERDDIEPEPGDGCLKFAHLQDDAGIVDIAHDCQAAQFGDNLAQQFKPTRRLRVIRKLGFQLQSRVTRRVFNWERRKLTTCSALASVGSMLIEMGAPGMVM